MTEDGRIGKETRVQFERLLPGPPERVWEFLTHREHLAAWISSGSGGDSMNDLLEPRVGGLVSLAGGHIRGVVTQWKPPRLLTYTWNVFDPGETESRYPESYVTFELKPQGNDVLLTLTHRPIVDRFEAQTLMGWHMLLDRLGSLVRGETPEPREILMERHRARYGVTEIQR